MEELIEALNILKKYISNDFNKEYPTSCEHDILMVHGIDFSEMSLTDVRRLYELGFFLGTDWDYKPDDIFDFYENPTDEDLKKALDFAKENFDAMSSFRFGSC